MGDRELVDQFVKDLLQKNSRMLSNRHLRLETTFDEVQLISYKDGIVARVKTDAPTLAIEVRDASPYRSLLEEIMVGYNIFQVGISQSAGFLRYEPRTIPEGYILQYTEGGVLWKDRWARGKRRSVLSGGGSSLGMDAMILYRGTWYPIQSVNAANGFISVRTLGGEVTYSASDFVVWLKKEKSESEQTPSQITSYKMGERLTQVDSAPTQILEKTDSASEDSTVVQATPAAAESEEHSLIAVPPPPVPAAAAVNPAEYSQGYPQQNYEHSVGYPYPSYPPQTYQQIDPNLQMALTYLQSSLAYLLQVEPKNPHIHAAIRATSMAIQNLLSILNN